MYKELVGGRDIEGDVSKQIGRGAKAKTIGERTGFSRIMAGTGLTSINNILRGDFAGAAKEIFGLDQNPIGDAISGGAAGRAAEEFNESRADGFSPQGKGPRPLPQSAAAMPQGTLTTQGQVSGEVRITVDQAGRVTAPPTIQLTGQQKSANAGYGSAQLNNAPPGDPTYNHAYNTFPAGGR
jgi:hypothetical protein